MPQLCESVTCSPPIAELAKRGFKKSLILKVVRINTKRSALNRGRRSSKSKRRTSIGLTRQGLKGRGRQQICLEALVRLTGQHEVLGAAASIWVRPSSSLTPRRLDLQGGQGGAIGDTEDQSRAATLHPSTLSSPRRGTRHHLYARSLRRESSPVHNDRGAWGGAAPEGGPAA